jgi:hypothetical protein
VFLIAFLSMALQVQLLIGSDGLDPLAPKLAAARERGLDAGVVYANPTLFWFLDSDAAIAGVCWAGVAVSVALTMLVCPRGCLAVLWALYLSLVTACGEFLAFQWDNLLLETAFFSIFYAPGGWLPYDGVRRQALTPPHPAARFLLVWLLFRLNFESGLAKWTFGDPHWSLSSLTAMVDYYETAPLPTWVGWYVHQLPRWVHVGCAGFTLVVELLAPFLLFGPRLARLVACALFFAFQLSIELTANYFIFNLLSVVLCLPALEDVKPGFRARWLPSLVDWRGRLFAAAAACLVLLTVEHAAIRVARADPPRFIHDIDRAVAPFRTINSYHLFAHLTLTRPEVEIQGSDDLENWQAYDFHYKPGDLTRAPAFVAPHQPRVDFRLWFVARLVPRPEQPGALRVQWADRGGLVNQIVKLLSRGNAAAAPLFRTDPFNGRAPRFVRVVIWQYRMTSLAERRASGAWWKREPAAIHPYTHDTSSGAPPRF